MKAMRDERGFTLVELIVASAIFSVFMVSTVGAFAAIMKIHEHSIVTRDAQTNGRLAIEDIARLLRNAHEACIRYDGEVCVKGMGSPQLVIDRYTTFLVSGGQLVLRKAGQADRPLTDAQGLTVTELSFDVPDVSVRYVKFSFRVDAKAATGVGQEWRINGGQGIMLGSTVSLRNGVTQ